MYPLCLAHPLTASRRAVTCKAVIAEPHTSGATQKAAGPIILDGQLLHSITTERLNLVKTLGPFVGAEVRISIARVVTAALVREGLTARRAVAASVLRRAERG